MKKTTKFIFTILSISFSTMTIASQYSTYIVNNNSDHKDNSIFIDYTICSDVLENNPICSAHEKRHIFLGSPEKFDFKSQKEVLYIWQASTYVYGGDFIENDYSKDVQGPNKELLHVSGCATTNRKLIVLDTYKTRKIIGCQIVISG